MDEAALREAWNSGKRVFPPKPDKAGQRWFLRTEINPERERDLVFIGINPSTATRFTADRDGADPTTRAILDFFPLNDDGSPQDWRSMTIVNLLPIIGQKKDLPRWSRGASEGRNMILQTIPTTRRVLETVLPSAACVHLMWGRRKGSGFDWKPTVLDKLAPRLLSLAEGKQVQAYLSPSTGDPYHPAYGWWRRGEFCGDARGLLMSK